MREQQNTGLDAYLMQWKEGVAQDPPKPQLASQMLPPSLMMPLPLSVFSAPAQHPLPSCSAPFWNPGSGWGRSDEGMQVDQDMIRGWGVGS